MSARAERSRTSGKLDLCPHQGCGFRCCEFQQGNYIVLHPGELEEARAAGESVDHLEVFDDAYHGGQRAVCNARDTSCCDGGYKPLDCASYPFFPTVGPDHEFGYLLKGQKCPIKAAEIPEHAAWTLRAWKRLSNERHEIREWLRHVTLVGYELVEETSDQPQLSSSRGVSPG